MNRDKTNRSSENTKKSPASIALTVIGIVLCVVLIPVLVVNCTIIVKSYIDKDSVPDFGGICPMIVLTDSMNSAEYPDVRFASGDLIFCHVVSADEIKTGDVITFFDPSGNGSSVVTHMVISIDKDEKGEPLFSTKGTNNNTADKKPVPASKLIGRYTGFKIKGAGNVAMFMQSTAGFIVCVSVPVVLLILFDRLRAHKYEKAKKLEAEALYAELEKLKASREAPQPEPEDTDGTEGN